MYEWNPVFNFCMDVKREYVKYFGNPKYKEYVSYVKDEAIIDKEILLKKEITCFEYWVEKLSLVHPDYKQKIKYLEINQRGNCILIRYGKFSSAGDGQQEITLENLWEVDNGFFLECRSVVINLENEEIVIAPFKKFRNLNECPENSLENVTAEIKDAKSIEITNKLDGSMQCLRWYHNGIFMTGSQAIDPDKSWRLTDGISRLTDDYIRMAKENPEYTFIFEYIALADAHVVKYTKEQEGLYLIGMRNVYTGKQEAYRIVKVFADKYNIPMTEIFNKTFDDVLEDIKVKKSDDMEGFVVSIDGHMIKVKCDDYVQIHRVLSKISSINLIIQSVANGTTDDLYSKVPEVYKPRVKTVEKIVLNYIHQMDTTVHSFYANAPKENKKDFMIWVDKNVPVKFKGYVRNLYLGHENNYIKYGNSKCPSYKKLNEMGVTDYKSIFNTEME